MGLRMWVDKDDNDSAPAKNQRSRVNASPPCRIQRCRAGPVTRNAQRRARLQREGQQVAATREFRLPGPADLLLNSSTTSRTTTAANHGNRVPVIRYGLNGLTGEEEEDEEEEDDDDEEEGEEMAGLEDLGIDLTWDTAASLLDFSEPDGPLPALMHPGDAPSQPSSVLPVYPNTTANEVNGWPVLNGSRRSQGHAVTFGPRPRPRADGVRRIMATRHHSTSPHNTSTRSRFSPPPTSHLRTRSRTDNDNNDGDLHQTSARIAHLSRLRNHRSSSPRHSHHPRVQVPDPGEYLHEYNRRRSLGANPRSAGARALDGLGDRDRSLSPEDGIGVWDTLQSTLTPDPQPPSLASSFASTSASVAASQTAVSVSTTNTSFATEPDTELEGPEPCEPANGGDDDAAAFSPAESSASVTAADQQHERVRAELRLHASRARARANMARAVGREHDHIREHQQFRQFLGQLQNVLGRLVENGQVRDDWLEEAGLRRRGDGA